MSDKVVELLKTFFHTRKSERYTPKEMLEKLKKNVEIGGLKVIDLPRLSTIENWFQSNSC